MSGALVGRRGDGGVQRRVHRSAGWLGAAGTALAYRQRMDLFSRVDPTTLHRRVAATRVARLLMPFAGLIGGYVSTELLVALPGGLGHPHVALALGEPPVDGCAADCPALVVLLWDAGRGAPGRWLEAGACAVWVLAAGDAVQHPPGPPGPLMVPGLPAVRLGVAEAVTAAVAPGASVTPIGVAGARRWD